MKKKFLFFLVLLLFLSKLKVEFLIFISLTSNREKHHHHQIIKLNLLFYLTLITKQKKILKSDDILNKYLEINDIYRKQRRIF